MSCCGPQKCANFDDDREGVSEEDIARFGGDDIACPNCGADVYHDAAYCPRCRHAMTEQSVSRGTPVWIPIAACAALLGFLLVVVL
ncbi:MAG: hypothetical protein SFZ24_00380 [Planctomycetota bacterium]|nr:hypothetical protein [Planctomycetota bacterium]